MEGQRQRNIAAPRSDGAIGDAAGMEYVELACACREVERCADEVIARGHELLHELLRPEIEAVGAALVPVPDPD